MQKKREELVAAAEASAQEAERRASYELTLKEKLKEQEAVIVKLKARARHAPSRLLIAAR